MWDHIRDRAHYASELMLRGQVPRNFTQITDAANSLASVFSVGVDATTTPNNNQKKKKKLSPLDVIGLYSYLPPKQHIWNLQPQDPNNPTRPKLVDEENYPGVYIPMHQNILNEETMEALSPGYFTDEEYADALTELDRQSKERIENEKRGITKPPAIIRIHNDGPGGDGSVREVRAQPRGEKPKPKRAINETKDGVCGRYATTGWHQPGVYTAVLTPKQSPNKKGWRWQECARECARRKPDECEYWTLQLKQDRNCLLLVNRGGYTDSGGHIEGDRDLDCLDWKTWSAKSEVGGQEKNSTKR